VEHILVVAARPNEFLREAPQRWKEAFGTNIHSIAIQMILITMGWWAEESHFNECFAYFRESDEEKRRPPERDLAALSGFAEHKIKYIFLSG
jgi:hypothetical protein